MNDQLNKEVLAISFQAAKLTERVLLAVLKGTLRQAKRLVKHNRAEHAETKHGEMKVKNLMAQGQGASSVELNEENFSTFKKILKSYNVDYAIEKDSSMQPPKYILFFKAKDTDVIKHAFRKYVAKTEKDKKRPSLKLRLEEKKEVVKKRTQERTKERAVDRKISKELMR